jgi:hypothetical protein
LEHESSVDRSKRSMWLERERSLMKLRWSGTWPWQREESQTCISTDDRLARSSLEWETGGDSSHTTSEFRSSTPRVSSSFRGVAGAAAKIISVDVAWTVGHERLMMRVRNVTTSNGTVAEH